MFGKGSAWARLMVSAWLLFFVTASCANKRYIADTGSPQPDLGLKVATGDVEVMLHHVIAPDSPGSWVKGARWIEWVITITTVSPSSVRIDRISLIDSRGVFVGTQYASLDEMAAESAKLTDAHKGLASAAIGQVVSAIIPMKVYAAALVSSFVGSYLEASDQDAIHAEFRKRLLPSPLELSEGAAVKGSVFSPLVPRPRALVMTYQADGTEERQVKLSLEPLWISPAGAEERP